MKKALVVAIGFNRPKSLQRLLKSLERVEPAEICADLIVSLDGGGPDECLTIADNMQWHHGATNVVRHTTNLGLVAHVEWCTDLVRDYDGIIILEDDLSVSPWMLHYCNEAMKFYIDDPLVAQISLYGPSYNEFQRLPLGLASRAEDTFLARAPASWGQLYFRSAWQAYRRWSSEGRQGVENSRAPSQIKTWKHSWKRPFFEYVSACEKTIVYPIVSLSTNHTEPGTNMLANTKVHEVDLECVQRSYCFTPTKAAHYNEWFEPEPSNFPDACFDGIENLSIDLSGIIPMEELAGDWLLSLRPCRKPVKRFSALLKPLELNVRWQVQADEQDDWAISLGRKEDFETDPVGIQFHLAYEHLGLESYQRGCHDGNREARQSTRFKIGDFLLAPTRWKLPGLNRSRNKSGAT